MATGQGAMKTGTRTGIIGQSGCGKSQLVKSLIIPSFRCRGVRTLVLDPLGYTDWGATHVWSPVKGKRSLEETIYDPRRGFCAVVDENENCAVIVDESGLSIGSNPAPEMVALATISRHKGHHVFFLAQRWIQIAKTMRDQIGGLFLFRVDYKDADEMALQFVEPKLKDAPQLKPRYFIEKHGVEAAIFHQPIDIQK